MAACLAGEGEWDGGGIQATMKSEAVQGNPSDSTETGSELVWTRVGHSLSSRPISVFPGPDCAYRFVMSSPTACFSTASLRSMSRVAIFPLPFRASFSAPA